MRTQAQAPQKLFLSIAVRVTVPVGALVVAVSIGAYLGLVHQSRISLLHAKEVAADMVLKLSSTSVMPAVVFGDPEGMQRAMDDLARNPEISGVELWASDAAPADGTDAPLAAVHRTAGALGRPSAPESRRWIEGGSIRLVEPVINPDGKVVAAITARVSTARETTALAQLARQILWVSAGTALCLIFAILWVINGVVIRPVKRLDSAAQRLAHGERVVPEGDAKRVRVEDEVVRLAATFGDMAEAVRDREARLGVRNAELKLILDSVRQGFLTVLPDGTLLPERSAILDTWFGPLSADETVSGVVGRIDPRVVDWFHVAWEQLLAGMLPLDMSLDQLPKRLERAGQHFDVGYHTVSKGEELDRVVLVLTDVTAGVEHQRTLAEQQEFATLVDHFVRNRRSFVEFWREAAQLIRGIGEPTEASKRDLHTLKGNARVFGLNRLSTLCHRLEDAYQEGRDGTAERGDLEAMWGALRERMDPLLLGATGFVEISKEDYLRLLSAVREHSSFELLEALVTGLRSEPTAWRLERARDAIEVVCNKLGKALPTIVMDHGDLRLPPGPLAPFWSVLSHVLNNAADHGLESDEERQAVGKPIPACIWLSTRMRNDELLIEVRDDGRGIAWDKVRQLARERGLAHASHSDLEAALLADGFSLKSSTTEVSGRGIGLAAVRRVVAAIGGRIELESAEGQGTRWSFLFPIRALAQPEADGSAQEALEPSPMSRIKELAERKSHTFEETAS